MEEYTTLIQTIALTMGVAWASGINLYGTLLALGIMSNTGYVDLPVGLEIVGDPLVLAAAGLMYAVEFFTDKIPGVDTGWDTLHTFVRIPAGALLAAGAIGDVQPAAELAAAIVGGSIAASSHFTKAGSRVIINTSPEPVTNWSASILEDIAVFVGIWASIQHPYIFIAILAVILAITIWLLPKLWRGIKRIFSFFVDLFSGKSSNLPDTNFPSHK